MYKCISLFVKAFQIGWLSQFQAYFYKLYACSFRLATMARVANFVELTIIWNSSWYIAIYIYMPLQPHFWFFRPWNSHNLQIFQLPASPAQVAVLQGHDGLALKSTCFPSTAYVPRTKQGLAHGFCWWVGVVGNWKVEDHLSLELQAETWLVLLWSWLQQSPQTLM